MHPRQQINSKPSGFGQLGAVVDDGSWGEQGLELVQTPEQVPEDDGNRLKSSADALAGPSMNHDGLDRAMMHVFVEAVQYQENENR